MAERIVLKGGMELFYNHCTANKATEFFVGIKTGHFDNGKNKGLAHFFEHMLFKGTTKHTADEISAIWHTKIRSLNAYTSNKSVRIYFYESNKRLEEGMSLASELLFDSTFPEEEMKKEKEVIKQEIAMRKDHFENNLIGRLIALSLGRLDICDGLDYCLGTPEDLDRYSREDLLKFKRENVCSNNIRITISTGLSLHKVKKLIKKYFIDRVEENQNLQSFDYKKLAMIGKPQSLIVTKNEKNKVFFTLFIKNNLKIDKVENGVYLGYLEELINGIGGEFLQKLREEKGLVYGARMGFVQSFQDGKIVFKVDTTKDKVNECLDTIREVCIDLLKNGVDVNNFEKIKEDKLLRQDFTIKTPKDACEKKVFFYDDYGRLPKKHEYQKIVKKTTYDDVNSLMYEALCDTNDVWFGAVGNLEKNDVYSHAKIKKMFDFRKYSKK